MLKTAELLTGFWWGKPGGKRPLWKSRHRWGDNIKRDLY